MPLRYNKQFVLRSVALLVCAALVVAFFDAPFVHFHEHATGKHAQSAHDGRGLAGHTHGGVTPTGSGPVLQSDPSGDDDAIFLTWLQSTPQAKPMAIALQPAAPVLNAAFVVVGSVVLPSPCSHDPPPFTSVGPRSPPASLPSYGA
jgi:hypothetical protein